MFKKAGHQFYSVKRELLSCRMGRKKTQDALMKLKKVE